MGVIQTFNSKIDLENAQLDFIFLSMLDAWARGDFQEHSSEGAKEQLREYFEGVLDRGILKKVFESMGIFTFSTIFSTLTGELNDLFPNLILRNISILPDDFLHFWNESPPKNLLNCFFLLHHETKLLNCRV